MLFGWLKFATARRFVAAFVVLLLGMANLTANTALLLSGQELESVPTVDVLYPAFTYESEPCTFTPNHFRNMRTYRFSEHRVMDARILRQGRYESELTPKDGSTSVELAWLQVPEGSAQISQYAVVSYRWQWVGGGSSRSDVVQVFGCKDDRLAVLQQISNDAHASFFESVRAGADYDVRTEVLTVKSVRYGAGAHCCAEKLDIVTFRWTGTRFEQVKWKTMPMPK